MPTAVAAPPQFSTGLAPVWSPDVFTIPSYWPPLRPPCTGPPGRAGSDAAIGHFLAGCVEVFNGYRPAVHLRCLVAPGRFEAVLAGLTDHAVPRHHPPRGSRATPPDSQFSSRISLLRTRICQVTPTAIESTAVFGDDAHSWALAMRWERLDGRWRCVLAQTVR